MSTARQQGQRAQAQAPPLVPLKQAQQKQAQQKQQKRGNLKRGRQGQQQQQQPSCEDRVTNVLEHTTVALTTSEDHRMTDDQQRDLERVVQDCPLNEHAQLWTNKLVAMGKEVLQWLSTDYIMQENVLFNEPAYGTDERGLTPWPPEIVRKRPRPLDDEVAHFRNVVALLQQDDVRGHPESLLRVARNPLRTWFLANSHNIQALIMARQDGLSDTAMVDSVLRDCLRFFVTDDEVTDAWQNLRLFNPQKPDDQTYLFSIVRDHLKSTA